MPWRVPTVQDERMRFVSQCIQGAWPVSAVCRAFGISRKTGYKYLARFHAGGWAALVDRSRAPHRQPHAIATAMRERVLTARRAHPSWGPRKLLPYLARRHPGHVWPAPSTVSALLHAAGLVPPRRRRRYVPLLATALRTPTEPNALWTADFKGWFRARNGARCDPLTVVDGASRFLLGCELLAHLDFVHVQAAFVRVFRTYGLPLALRTDNGAPFASTALGGLTRLAVWWLKLGIALERTRPGNPGGNARHERLHLTLQQTMASTPRATWAAQQRACGAFRDEYNHERPHAALANCTPADCYHPSPRSYPTRLTSPTYDTDCEVRVVYPKGYVRWHGHELFVSEALAGEPIGLRQLAAPHWVVHYGAMQLGLVDAHTGRLLRFRSIQPAPLIPDSEPRCHPCP